MKAKATDLALRKAAIGAESKNQNSESDLGMYRTWSAIENGRFGKVSVRACSGASDLNRGRIEPRRPLAIHIPFLSSGRGAHQEVPRRWPSVLEVTYQGPIRCASGHRHVLLWTEIHDAPRGRGKELKLAIALESIAQCIDNRVIN